MKNKHQSNGKEVGQSIKRLKAAEFHLEKYTSSNPHLILYTEINSMWIKILNVKYEMYQNNVGVLFCFVWFTAEKTSLFKSQNLKL